MTLRQQGIALDSSRGVALKAGTYGLGLDADDGFSLCLGKEAEGFYIKLNGQGIELKFGPSSLKISPTGITLVGPNIQQTADASYKVEVPQMSSST